MKNFKFVSIIVFAVTLITASLFVNTNKAIASNATLSSQEFSVWNGGGIIGYDAGFTLSGDATFNGAKSIIIRLYSGSTLLQTNTAVPGKIKGTGFLTPFDVFGVFNYTKDGYFTNVRESEYGRVLIPTKVVATVVLADGKIVTATNTSLISKDGCYPGYSFNGITGENCQSGQVLGAGAFYFTQSMKIGSKGNEVMELQRFLNASGYNSGNPDGVFGQNTKNAVVSFQIANGLKGDGSVGAITRTVLNK